MAEWWDKFDTVAEAPSVPNQNFDQFEDVSTSDFLASLRQPAAQPATAPVEQPQPSMLMQRMLTGQPLPEPSISMPGQEDAPHVPLPARPIDPLERAGRRAVLFQQLNDVRQGVGDVQPKTFADAARETVSPSGLVGMAPFVGPLAQAGMEKAPLLFAARRLVKGGNDPKDIELILAHQKDEERGGDLGYTVGKLVAQLPAFWLEFLATGGLYNLGKAAGQKAIVAGVEKLIGEATAKAVKFKLAESAGELAGGSIVQTLGQKAATVGAELAGTAAGAAIQNIPMAAARVPGLVADRMTPQLTIQPGADGKLSAVIRTKDGVEQAGETFEEALPKAFLDSYVEVLTEHSGKFIGGALGAAAKLAKLDKIPIPAKLASLQSAIEKWTTLNPGKPIAQFLKLVKNRTAWDGYLEEHLEEFAADALKPLLGLQEWKMPTTQEMLTRGIGFAIPGLAHAGIAAIVNARDARDGDGGGPGGPGQKGFDAQPAPPYDPAGESPLAVQPPATTPIPEAVQPPAQPAPVPPPLPAQEPAPDPVVEQPKPVASVVPEEIRVGEVGGKLVSGEVVKTASGRTTTPFPKVDTSTSRKASSTVTRVDGWLHANAVAEAKARGDEFNLRQFESENPKKLPQASKDSMEQYLFGEEQAEVPKPFLKPLGKEPNAQQDTSPKTLHGDVRQESKQAQAQVPPVESGGGVSEQGQEGEVVPLTKEERFELNDLLAIREGRGGKLGRLNTERIAELQARNAANPPTAQPAPVASKPELSPTRKFKNPDKLVKVMAGGKEISLPVKDAWRVNHADAKVLQLLKDCLAMKAA